jgi:hypothetical protein
MSGDLVEITCRLAESIGRLFRGRLSSGRAVKFDNYVSRTQLGINTEKSD